LAQVLGSQQFVLLDCNLAVLLHVDSLGSGV
jgi:hypothetical protein